jgi:chemotaxis signal transduction protein
MTEVLAVGDTIAVPLAPPYCRELLRWNDELLPVFDLRAWHGTPAADAPSLLAVVAYQERPGAPLRRGCLRVATFPKVITVDDAQACPLSAPAWAPLALSCFRDEDGAVPILSLGKLFNFIPGSGLQEPQSGHRGNTLF